MENLRYIYQGVFLSITLLLSVTGSAQRAPAFSGSDLTEPPTLNWLTNGGDLYNRRYSPLDQINRSNLDRLKGVWRTRLGGSGVGSQYSGEAQLIVYEGVIYVVTGADDTFAISVDTGEVLWRYKANLDTEIDTICCGWTSRGVGLGDGKVFVGQLDGKLLALDQLTGNVVWSVQAERWQEGYSITSAPLYYDGMVITGFAGAEYGTRGRVKAYDADSGDLIWTFFTVPAPGEFGHETWPQGSDIWKHGGATVWQTPAIDPELGLLYFSTGNPGPDFNGAIRAGDNLFSISMVAVDTHSGEYRWHFQQIHHDIWDFDAATPVVLFDVEIDGMMRRAIGSINKAGYLYILDRATGEPLIGIDEVAVPQEPRQATAATQPIPRGEPVAPLTIDVPPEGFTLPYDEHVFVPFWNEQVVGQRSGANWPPNSYDPERNLLFVCLGERLSFYIVNENETDMPPGGERYMGGRFGRLPGMPSTGILAAVDVTTNIPVWRQRWADRCYSGSIATGGGLLFAGRSDGRFMAFNSDTGLPMWEFQTGAGVNTTASTFEHDGEQHVAVLSAGNIFAGSPRGDSVWLFSLNGSLEPVPPPTPTLTVPVGPPIGFPNIDNGRVVYAQACVACHGEDGQGGHGTGAPITPGQSLNTLARIVAQGQNDMPPFTPTLSLVQIRDVSAYVVEVLAP